MNELKPCPYCNGETAIDSIFIMGGEQTWWYVKCLRCGGKFILVIKV